MKEFNQPTNQPTDRPTDQPTNQIEKVNNKMKQVNKNRQITEQDTTTTILPPVDLSHSNY